MADTKFGEIAVYEDDDGKAVWEFEGKVQSDIPLDTEAQDFAGAINELKKLSAEGGGEGYLRAVIDDDISSLTIVSADGAEDESHGVYNYTYEPLEISDEIKTQIKSGDVVTTNTKKFSVRLIAKLYNISGELIFRAECSSKGKITGFYDGGGKELYTQNFGLNLGENIGISGADAPAVAWCMAKNSERSSSLTSQKKSYRDGLNDSGADVSEDYSEDGSLPIEIDGSPEGPADKVTVPGITDMSDGVYYALAAGESDTVPAYYLRIYQDGEAGEDMSAGGWWRFKYTSHLCCDVYDAEKNLLSSNKLGYWYCRTYYLRNPNKYGYDWVSNITINGDKCTVARTRLPIDVSGETMPEETEIETIYLPVPSGSTVLSTGSNFSF